MGLPVCILQPDLRQILSRAEQGSWVCVLAEPEGRLQYYEDRGGWVRVLRVRWAVESFSACSEPAAPIVRGTGPRLVAGLGVQHRLWMGIHPEHGQRDLQDDIGVPVSLSQEAREADTGVPTKKYI